jgi:hypothetical protein
MLSSSAQNREWGELVLIDKTSLSQTVDAINLAIFEGRTISAAERKSAARWIASRQGLPGAYAETFAGFEVDRKIAAFTGERFTDASARHILGEETSRVLRLLRVADPVAKKALERANEGMLRCLAHAAADNPRYDPGKYCCGKCTISLWRNLVSGGLDRQEERLRKGAVFLRTMRKGAGEWRRFPFWYTVLALGEINLPEVTAELKYASPALQRIAKGGPGRTEHARRRHEIARRALERL